MPSFGYISHPMAKTLRPLTPERVRAGVLRHVQRYSAPRQHVRRLYLRKIDTSLRSFEGDREVLVAALDEALGTAEHYGYINDARFAEVRAARGIARGVSPRQIQARLGAKGIDSAAIEAGLASTEGNPEVLACAAYVKRRRMGGWRPPEERVLHRERDLARLGRAGFSYTVARASLDVGGD